MRFLFLLILTLFCGLTVYSCSLSPSNPITIDNAWIREAPPGASAMAGYMNITNTSERNLILHKAESSDFKAIEFHRSVEKDGVYTMVPHLHLHINAASSIELKPGDYHLMMFSPKRELKSGDEAEIKLIFSNNLSITVAVPVKKAVY